MDITSVSIRGGPGVCALIAVFSFAWHVPAHADVTRFALAGSATKTATPAVQRSGSLTLRARLEAQDAALAVAPPVQDGGGFVLQATLAPNAAVCYNDTIFRDDFDADGG